ncbi:MAG: 16S rRNA (guanine(966)-N(2))-methyltransferase RsmD [Sphingomicrobium sp.]
MRIVAGEWRGRPLVAPKGMATRPTADRVRETLFSMLTSRLGSFTEVAVADLFAGSGGLGLEALSRGAASTTFVERDSAALAALKANLATLGGEARAQIIAGDALKLPRGRGPFDLILADPPYAVGSGNAVAAAVMAASWLAPGGWLVVETERREAVAHDALTVEAERVVGRARLTFLRS